MYLYYHLRFYLQLSNVLICQLMPLYYLLVMCCISCKQNYILDSHLYRLNKSMVIITIVCIIACLSIQCGQILKRNVHNTPELLAMFFNRYIKCAHCHHLQIVCISTPRLYLIISCAKDLFFYEFIDILVSFDLFFPSPLGFFFVGVAVLLLDSVFTFL